MASRFDDEEKPAANVRPLAVKKPVAAPPFPYTWVSQAELKLDGRPILKGLIDPGGFMVIYGPSGSGKSFFTADMAQHIATGQPWRGRRCSKGLVVYVASEAGNSILKRFVGWRENRLGESAGNIPLAIITRGPNLLNTVDIEKLVEQLALLQGEAALPLALVIFDTLSRSIPGGDENSAEDMTMAVNTADYLREKFNCATAYVHHSGKDPDKGARGHSALFAAADIVLRVVDHAATVEKVRDGVAGERFGFELEPVEVGIDFDGDPVMTCLLNVTEHESQLKRREPIGKNQRILWKEVIGIAADSTASPGTSEIPKGCKVFRFDNLVARSLPRFPGLEPFRAKARISEAVTSLQATGFIGVHGELVWVL